MVRITKEWLDMQNAGNPQPVQKKNKMGAKQIIIDGIKFQSTGEGERYIELKLQQHCKVISGLELQPKFILQDKCVVHGQKISAVKYKADFKYMKDGKTIVEDFKGVKTEAYGIRRRLFIKKFPEYYFLETRK